MESETQRLYDSSNENEPIGRSDEAIEAFRSEYFGNLEKYGRLSDTRSTVREKFEQVSTETADRMVEMAVIAAVSSIRTETDRWEYMMGEYLKGGITQEEFLQNCRDGQVKAEKVEHVFNNTEIIREARQCFRLGLVTEGIEELIGRPSKNTDETYMRATKAHFVAWLLGYDRVCMDHRIHRAMEPVIRQVMTDVPSRRPDEKHAKVTMAKKRPTNVEYWHDVLKWSPREYHVLTRGLVDYVAEWTEIPRDRITQVAFNVGGDGETTTHETLMNVLGA